MTRTVTLLLFVTVAFYSCGEKEPRAIQKRIFYDTLKQGDSTSTERNYDLPEDRTEVVDSARFNDPLRPAAPRKP